MNQISQTCNRLANSKEAVELGGVYGLYRTLALAYLGRIEEARADLAELEKLRPALPTG